MDNPSHCPGKYPLKPLQKAVLKVSQPFKKKISRIQSSETRNVNRLFKNSSKLTWTNWAKQISTIRKLTKIIAHPHSSYPNWSVSKIIKVMKKMIILCMGV